MYEIKELISVLEKMEDNQRIMNKTLQSIDDSLSNPEGLRGDLLSIVTELQGMRYKD